MVICAGCRSTVLCEYMRECFLNKYAAGEAKDSSGLAVYKSGLALSGELKDMDDKLADLDLLKEETPGKISLQEIIGPEVYHAVFVGFENDLLLMNQFHPVRGNFELMVSHTVSDIQGVTDRNEGSICAVLCDGITVGYACMLGQPRNILYSFAINIEYRKKELLVQFLECVSEKMNGERYMVPAEKRDVRKIGFLQKNKFEVVSNDNDFLIFSSPDVADNT